MAFNGPGIPAADQAKIFEEFQQPIALSRARRAAPVSASGLRGASPSLELQFDRAVEEAKRSIHVPTGNK